MASVATAVLKGTAVTFFSLAGTSEVIGFNHAPTTTPAPSSTITGNGWAFDNVNGLWYNWVSPQGFIMWNTAQASGGSQIVTTSPTPSITASSTTTPMISSDTSQPKSEYPTSISSSTQNSPSSKPVPAKASSKGISNGAAAGIGVGCLLAGVLISGLIFYLCTARARRRKRSRDRETGTVPFLKGAIPLNTKEQTLENSPTSYNLESSLAQPLEDRAVSGEISKISNSVKNHVQSYYHTGKMSPGLLDHEDLQALGSDLPMSPGTLSTLLANPDTREIALRFSIAWVLIARIRLDSHPRTTFLPPEIAQCVQSMRIDVGETRGTKAVFFSKWRAISAELLQNSYGGNPISSGDARNHNIFSALEALDGVLKPFADSRMDNNQRRRNLEEILKRAASFAFVLFSQPSSWDFDWQDQDAFKSGSLCIFPSLIQVVDDAGEALKHPRPFSEAVVRQLDG